MCRGFEAASGRGTGRGVVNGRRLRWKEMKKVGQRDASRDESGPIVRKRRMICCWRGYGDGGNARQRGVV